ncbi:MAG: class 1 fructose-bisphosphatase [Candidatus Dasytiphilus stammeri]
MKPIEDFFREESKNHLPIKIEELIDLLSGIQNSAKNISNYLSQGKLFDLSKVTQTKNIHGENQIHFDIIANNIIKMALNKLSSNYIAAILTEEDEDFIVLHDEGEKGKYIMLIDPIDGSSNIKSNISIGTIFSIYHRISPIGSRITKEDFLQPGKQQIAAGYIIYGFSTILVLTIGYGVYIFVYNPLHDIWYLNNKDLKFPKTGYIYSINDGNHCYFSLGIKHYIEFCHQINQSTTQHPYTLRYTGSLVADFHRNLLQGGIYIYPQNLKHPEGKLRLLYECNPLAFIAEQAGGKASNGISRILDITPITLHQYCPLFIGNREMVDKVELFLKNDKNR